MNLSIMDIEKACGGSAVLRGADASRRVSSVVIDSRKVTEGGVFIAVPGERVDGHRFIGEVCRAGVSLVITEKTPEQVEQEHGVAPGDWGSYLAVENSLQALKAIAEYYRSRLAIPIVGITGSVGKTSTKEFIAGALAERYRVLKTEGNLNNEIGVPLTLLRIDESHQAAVVEMGISDFGEMHRLSKMVRPTLCVITNIGQCHLENLKDRDGILKAKTEMFDYMMPDAGVCLNGADDKLRSITQVQGKPPVFFGLEPQLGEQVYATDIVSKGLWGSQAVLHMPSNSGAGQISFPVEIPLPGIHMVTNAAAAACVAGLLGLEPWEIAAGIAKVAPIGGRNHLIRTENYTLIDDCYNANPVSMKAAISLLAMADTRKTAILGDMFELGEDSDAMHAGVGSYAVEMGIDSIICIGENARHIYAAACEAVEQSKEKSPATTAYFPDKASFIGELHRRGEELLPKGTTILIKASHGMEFTELVSLLRNPFCS